MLVHLEQKFCGVSISDNNTILSEICTAVALLFNKCTWMYVAEQETEGVCGLTVEGDGFFFLRDQV